MTVPLTLLRMTPLSGYTGPELTPYSARGLNQTLDLIPDSSKQIRRDVRGKLMNLAYSQFRKYQSVITCTDAQAPAFDEAWRGIIVEVECAKELGYRTHGGTPQRPEVSGSSREEGDFTYYRPLLTMMVVDVHNSLEEWRANDRWQIDLLEV